MTSLARLGAELGLGQKVLDGLERYREIIQQYGGRLNLVGRLTDDFIRTELIAGSLQLLRLARPTGRLVDVGSGAGLPGIPLALALPELAVTLVEPRERRAAFLRRAAQLLGREMRVEAKPIEGIGEQFDWAVSRAWKPPGDWLAAARRLLVPGGRVGVYTTAALWKAAEIPSEFTVMGTAKDPTSAGNLVAIARLQGSLPSGWPSPS